MSKNRHHNRFLQFAWNKYGKDSFEFSVIETCSHDDRLEKEQYFIDLHKSTDDSFGYNLSLKTSHPCHSDVTRKKISEKVRAAIRAGKIFGHRIPHTEESKKKMSETRRKSIALGVKYGHFTPHTQESKDKMRASSLGQTPWNKGVPMTDSAKHKLSNSLKKLYKNKESHNKKSHCHLGHPMSGENLYVSPKGSRNCKCCAKERMKKFKQKNRVDAQNDN